MSTIEKLTLENPAASIMIIKNARINNNIIYYNNNSPNFLPTMYESWRDPQTEHIQFMEDKSIHDISNNNILYIFDTWGISSYYHLLIDHIIPLWITTKIIEQKVDINLQTKKHYYRVSNNNYTTSLSNSNEIFKFIFNDNWVDNIHGNFKYIIYGYAFTYRPYHGPKYELKYYENYKNFINHFQNSYFYKNPMEQEKYIIIPKRITRNNSIIEIIFKKLNPLFKIKYIDFSEHSINEQVILSASAFAFIGMEGAAFSNQIFMPKNSCLICILPNDTDNSAFHSTLSKYLQNKFYSFCLNEDTNYIIDGIVKILHNHLLEYSNDTDLFIP
jgi:hypothetical protein